MPEIQLHYGPIHIRVLSDMRVAVPLPQCIDTISMASLPMTFTIRFHPGSTADAMEGERCVPDALLEQSRALTRLGIRFLPIEQHCNRWYWSGGQLQGVFPYDSDGFVLRFTPGSGEVTLFGNEENLDRVILDILSCYAMLPPLHTAAVCKDGNAMLLLADSGAGKTRMLLRLLECGYSYLADEEVFWEGERVCGIGQIIRQKDGRPAIAQKVAQSSYPVAYSVLLYRSTPVRPVLFPLIARQSVWAQDAASLPPTVPFVDRMAAAAVRYAEIVDHAQPFHIDHCDFEESASGLIRLIQGRMP